MECSLENSYRMPCNYHYHLLFEIFNHGMHPKNLVNQRMESSGPYLSTSKEVFSFISNNTETDDIIVFRKPRVMRLFTNRQSIMTDQVDNLTKGDYLCISLHPGAYHQIRNYDVVSLRENRRIHLVYQNMDFQLYQIKNRRSQD